MFLLFGTDLSEKVINVVSFVCGFCAVGARQDVIKSSTRFTLFFIPLFSFSTPLTRCFARFSTRTGTKAPHRPSVSGCACDTRRVVASGEVSEGLRSPTAEATVE